MDQRLQELVCVLKKPAEPQRPKGFAVMGFAIDVLKTLLPALVILWATSSIKDSVDQALHERQLQLENVKAMGELATGMQSSKLTQEQATDYAVRLAAFGKYSIPFFVNVLEVGSQISTTGAEQGLRMVSRSEQKEVCQQLAMVIGNRTGLYRWTTHLTALRLIGEAGCSSATSTVKDYVASLQPVEILKTWVSSQPTPDTKECTELAEQAVKTQKVLEGISLPNRSNP